MLNFGTECTVTDAPELILAERKSSGLKIPQFELNELYDPHMFMFAEESQDFNDSSSPLRLEKSDSVLGRFSLNEDSFSELEEMVPISLDQNKRFKSQEIITPLNLRLCSGSELKPKIVEPIRNLVEDNKSCKS